MCLKWQLVSGWRLRESGGGSERLWEPGAPGAQGLGDPGRGKAPRAGALRGGGRAGSGVELGLGAAWHFGKQQTPM